MFQLKMRTNDSKEQMRAGIIPSTEAISEHLAVAITIKLKSMALMEWNYLHPDDEVSTEPCTYSGGP